MTTTKLPLEKRVPFWASLPEAYQADVRALDEVSNPYAWFVGVPHPNDNGDLLAIEYLAVTATGEGTDDERHSVISVLMDFEESSISTRELANNNWNSGYDA